MLKRWNQYDLGGSRRSSWPRRSRRFASDTTWTRYLLTVAASVVAWLIIFRALHSYSVMISNPAQNPDGFGFSQGIEGEKYANKRAEMWGLMRAWIRTRLDPDGTPDLRAQLVAPTYTYNLKNENPPRKERGHDEAWVGLTQTSLTASRSPSQCQSIRLLTLVAKAHTNPLSKANTTPSLRKNGGLNGNVIQSPSTPQPSTASLPPPGGPQQLTKPARKSMQPTILSTAMTPETGTGTTGNKTLLGQ